MCMWSPDVTRNLESVLCRTMDHEIGRCMRVCVSSYYLCTNYAGIEGNTGHCDTGNNSNIAKNPCHSPESHENRNTHSGETGLTGGAHSGSRCSAVINSSKYLVYYHYATYSTCAPFGFHAFRCCCCWSQI